MFSPVLEIASSAGHGGYFTTFFEKKNKIIFYDSEFNDYYKLSQDLTAIIKKHPIKHYPTLKKQPILPFHQV